MTNHKVSCLAILVYTLCMGTSGCAQRAPLFLGTKMPYTQPGDKITSPPPGFSAVFINYVGRHGARFLTKAGSDITALQVLQYAGELGVLTAKGKRLKVMTEQFIAIEKGNYENITQLGAGEQEEIGERMSHNYQSVFKGKGLDVIMTHKVRTQQSADAFLKSFNQYPGQKNKNILPDSMDYALRFYDLSPGYERFKGSASIQTRIDSLAKDRRTDRVARDICSRLFTPAFCKKMMAGIDIPIGSKKVTIDAILFSEYLYDLYGVQFSVPLELEKSGTATGGVDFGIAFSRDDLAWLSFRNEAEDFLEKGAGLDTLGIQVRVAVPLLMDFLSTTASIADGSQKKDAILRFTHAEAISPFATLLGLRIASVPNTSIYHFQEKWQAENIIPLSANIQWIVYSNGKEYLLKVLLNERESALPLPTDMYPFYHWEAVREYYVKKMATLKVSGGEDMRRYLSGLE